MAQASTTCPLTRAARVWPSEAREGRDGPVVFVGMAGERREQGIRGRLTVYIRGKELVSGLGEAAMDRALADARLAATSAG